MSRNNNCAALIGVGIPFYSGRRSKWLKRLSSLVMALIMLVNIVQYSYWGMQDPLYSALRVCLIGLMVILFFLTIRMRSFVRALNNVAFLKTMFWSVFVFALAVLFANAFGEGTPFGTLRDVAILFLVLLIGFSADFGEQNRGVILAYIVLGTISACTFPLVLGFEVSEHYMIDTKNQIAPFYGCLAVIAASRAIYHKRERWWMVLCAGLLIAVIAILRARTCLLAVTLCVVLFLFLQKRTTSSFKVVLSVVILALFLVGADLIADIFFSGKDIHDIDSISSGRVSRIVSGIDYLSSGDNFLLGSAFGEAYSGDIVHVFLLNLWINYGFLLSLPISVLYTVLLLKVLRQIFHVRSAVNSWIQVIPYLILMLFIISFNEYSYPFSPISSLFLAYLLYGGFLRSTILHSK